MPLSFELSSAGLLASIQSLLAEELKALRPQQAGSLFPEDWTRKTQLQQRSTTPCDNCLNADSMERMALVTRVADFFQLRVSGLEDYLLRFNTLGEWVDLILEARKRGTRNLSFMTSGSSGQPKVCEHSWDKLVAEAQFFAQQLSPPPGNTAPTSLKRFLALVPCHHIYGFLFSVLLPELMQLPVVRGTQAFAQAQGRRLEAGDFIVGFPFVWKQLSRSQQPFPPGVLGSSSTGPSDPQRLQQLQQQGLGGLLEIYGASETGGLGFRWSAEAPYQLLPRWQSFEQSEDLLLEAGTNQLTPVNDALEWLDERHFFISGRLDGGVQVAGMNVFPLHLAQQLEALPEVAQARIRLMAPDEGERLKAFIVPARADASHQQLQAFLQDWCQKNWHPLEAPRAFTFGDSLPTTAMGKACDWPVRTPSDA